MEPTPLDPRGRVTRDDLPVGRTVAALTVEQAIGQILRHLAQLKKEIAALAVLVAPILADLVLDTILGQGSRIIFSG
jgi:hypothetical protein